jgi:tRNA(Ile)-lysidine synthase
VAYLGSLGQPWREDSSNAHLTFTRNRIRHELLPLLESWNPQLRDHLAQMATLARDEDAFWQSELSHVIPSILLTGRPVRGGGRASGPESTLVLDLARLAELHPALQRRLLRSVAQQLGAALDFAATESLRALALDGRAGQKLQLEGLHAERTHRELRLDSAAVSAAPSLPEYPVPIPGQIEAPLFDLRLRVELTFPAPSSVNVSNDSAKGTGFSPYSHEAKSTRALAPEGISSGDSPQIARQIATLRNWRPGDRVHLRYSSGPRKVKEVLDRLKVTGSARALWPVLEINGRILWMKGVELEPTPGLRILAEPRDSSS